MTKKGKLLTVITSDEYRDLIEEKVTLRCSLDNAERRISELSDRLGARVRECLDLNSQLRRMNKKHDLKEEFINSNLYFKQEFEKFRKEKEETDGGSDKE